MNYFKFKNHNKYNLTKLMKCSSMKEIHLKTRALLIINQSILKAHKNFRIRNKSMIIFLKNHRFKRIIAILCLMKYHLNRWVHQRIVMNAGSRFFKIMYKVKWCLLEIKLLRHKMRINFRINYLPHFVMSISICIPKITKLSLSVSLTNLILTKKTKTLL
jgi:hypothetical protein